MHASSMACSMHALMILIINPKGSNDRPPNYRVIGRVLPNYSLHSASRNVVKTTSNQLIIHNALVIEPRPTKLRPSPDSPLANSMREGRTDKLTEMTCPYPNPQNKGEHNT